MTFGEAALLIYMAPALGLAGVVTLVVGIAFLVWLFDRRV